MICPLCKSLSNKPRYQNRFRAYHVCTNCSLIFVPNQYQVDSTKARRRYALHKNTIEDVGYLQFLNRILYPLKDRISKDQFGLDFGSGPNPVLSEVLKKDGYQITEYDLYFANDPKKLNTTYNYIVCCEVVEHFDEVLSEWKRLFELLKPEGWIAISTALSDQVEDFLKWHYISDETHISIYSKRSFEWIKEYFGFKQLIFISDSIIFLRK